MSSEFPWTNKAPSDLLVSVGSSAESGRDVVVVVGFRQPCELTTSRGQVRRGTSARLLWFGVWSVAMENLLAKVVLLNGFCWVVSVSVCEVNGGEFEMDAGGAY